MTQGPEINWIVRTNGTTSQYNHVMTSGRRDTKPAELRNKQVNDRGMDADRVATNLKAKYNYVIP